MKIRDYEELTFKLRGVRTWITIISEAPDGFTDFDMALGILEEVLDECIEFIQKEENLGIELNGV